MVEAIQTDVPEAPDLDTAQKRLKEMADIVEQDVDVMLGQLHKLSQNRPVPYR